jgi:hypothetical protein
MCPINPGRYTARDRARRCRDYLREQGWPEPIFADSGNGAHLRYRFDLPNAPVIMELIKGCLNASSTTDHDRPVAQGYLSPQGFQPARSGFPESLAHRPRKPARGSEHSS